MFQKAIPLERYRMTQRNSKFKAKFLNYSFLAETCGTTEQCRCYLQASGSASIPLPSITEETLRPKERHMDWA